MSEIDPRASDADRERVGALLRDAAADGRLTLDELNERLGSAYAARTRGQLEELTRDLAAAPPLPARRRRRRFVFALMSGAGCSGPVRIERSLNVATIMGGAEIDLREAELVGGEVTVRALALMGGIGVIVPPGVDVDVGGVFSLMGGHGSDAPPAPPGSPRVRIRGLVLMGGLGVKMRRRRTG